MAKKMMYQEFGGGPTGRFRRNHYVPLDDDYYTNMLNHLKRLNYSDCYATVYVYDTTEIEQANLYGPIYLDLDGKIDTEEDFALLKRDVFMAIAALEQVYGIPADQVEVFFSGSKGFHLIVREQSIGLIPVKNLEMYYKAIAVRIKGLMISDVIDTGIYDKKRLFRIENTINSKTGLYKVPITQKHLREITLEDMKRYASEPRQVITEPKRLIPGALQKIVKEAELLAEQTHKQANPGSIIAFKKRPPLPCVLNLVEQGSMEGGRNNDCVAIASSLAQSGFSHEEAIQILLSWNQKTEPPLPESEVLRTVKSAYDIAQEGRGYGCNFFKEHDHCIGNACRLYK